MPSGGDDIARSVHISLQRIGAGDGNRTHTVGLGSRSSTIELRPHDPETEDTLTPRRGQMRPRGVGRSQACLATGHHAEVGTLSGRGHHFIPVSVRLQDDVRFLRNPLPATVSPDLAACLVHHGRRVGLTLFRIDNRNREGSAIPPVDLKPTCPDQAAGQPSTPRFGTGPISRFGPFSFTVFIGGSLTLTLRSSLAPQPVATTSLPPDPSRG